jgi:hypothetical protein
MFACENHGAAEQNFSILNIAQAPVEGLLRLQAPASHPTKQGRERLDPLAKVFERHPQAMHGGAIGCSDGPFALHHLVERRIDSADRDGQLVLLHGHPHIMDGLFGGLRLATFQFSANGSPPLLHGVPQQRPAIGPRGNVMAGA